MRDIPVADLLRAELRATERKLQLSDVAHLELRNALNAAGEQIALLRDLLATVIHRSGEALITVTDGERKAAEDACWLRFSIDFLEDDDDGSRSARVSLMPPTPEELKKHAENLKAAESKPSGLKLIDP